MADNVFLADHQFGRLSLSMVFDQIADAIALREPLDVDCPSRCCVPWRLGEALRRAATGSG
ncbi:hypothetical protein QUC32_28090 (plasmid) [Novosphingobium resinovorum]|uniref:hypothetical protein n=1 Tax=Sphingomonadaceae TaxID=41297 RepID=UPI0012EAC5A2|nr:MULTISPECIES: hypothetical protein [Sphingomonadaceae]MBF7015548.1 hypothetical protein [Novosphingobium sp. HR1a]WJM30224.1 hypothetical protein QUC32_28090 [Novosphingobium resinovorum]